MIIFVSLLQRLSSGSHGSSAVAFDDILGRKRGAYFTLTFLKCSSVIKVLECISMHENPLKFVIECFSLKVKVVS